VFSESQCAQARYLIQLLSFNPCRRRITLLLFEEGENTG